MERSCQQEDGPEDPELKGEPDLLRGALPEDLNPIRSKHGTHVSEVSLHSAHFLLIPWPQQY